MALPEPVVEAAGQRALARRGQRVAELMLCSVLHFSLSLATAFIGYGWDLDQLRSRSLISRVGAAVNDVLTYPHDAALRQIPNPWLIRNLWVIPTALVLHSLLWGAALYAGLRLWRYSRRR